MSKNTIGQDGCACGLYKSTKLYAEAVCRKSGSSPEVSCGIAHLLKYKILQVGGELEVGAIVEDMLDFGADCVVLQRIED